MSTLLQQSTKKTNSKIIMVVIDGLGGMPHPQYYHRSELEVANLPNLDNLSSVSSSGLTIPVDHGITPGSGPGHLALFGYDPTTEFIGRGVLETLGIGINLTKNDLAIRGNFCTINQQGIITNRRANRINNNEAQRLCKLLQDISPSNFEIHHVMEHRFAIVIRSSNEIELNAQITDTDPQVEGEKPLQAEAINQSAKDTVNLINNFQATAKKTLAKETQGNMILLRGYSQFPKLASFQEKYLLNPCAIAAYPMYRGIAKLAGMTIKECKPNINNQLEVLKKNVKNHDFFFFHYKNADAKGEDGDFESKVQSLEQIDSIIGEIRNLNPDVLIVCGDHSTPSFIGGHSWHPVPLIIHSKWTNANGIKHFDEKHCAKGDLGILYAKNIMNLALSHSGKLSKFGA